MSLTTALIVVACVLVAGRWLVRAVFVPNRVCRACGGSGNNPLSGGGRQGDCWFCGGRRKRKTWGARVVRWPFRAGRWGR